MRGLLQPFWRMRRGFPGIGLPPALWAFLVYLRTVTAPVGVLLFSCSVVSDSFVNPGTVARQVPLVHGISQARILEWAAISSSRESSQPRD